MKGLHSDTLSIQAGGVFLGSLKGLDTCVCMCVCVCVCVCVISSPTLRLYNGITVMLTS